MTRTSLTVRTRAVLRQKGALADDRPGAELTRSLGSLDEHAALDGHEEAHAGLAAFDQRLPGCEHGLRPYRRTFN